MDLSRVTQSSKATTVINELRTKVSDLLERFADDDGVSSFCHRQEAKIKFEFKTPDEIPVSLVFDINQVSRKYINNMIQNIIEGLEKERKSRHESPIIIH